MKFSWHYLINYAFKSWNSLMSWSLDFVSELDDLFELVILVLELFVCFLKIFDFLLTDEKFFLTVPKICQKFFVLFKNLSSLGRMDVAIWLLCAWSKDIVESEVNILREELNGGRKVFFGGELGVASGSFVLVEGAFGFNRRMLLTTSKRDV